MIKKYITIRSGKWQTFYGNAIESGCQNYRWELGRVGKELKAIFADYASRKKNSNNVIDLVGVSKKIA